MSKLGQSYGHGVGGQPLIGETIGVHFDRIVELWPDNDALVVVEQGICWSYAEFKQKVDALAAGFLTLGLEPGDRIGIWSPNNAEWALTQFASAKAGLILVNINPAYRLAEVEYALNEVGCKALVSAAQFKKSDYIGMLQTLAPELADAAPGALAAAKLPELKSVIRIGADATPGMLNFDEVAPRGGAAERARLDELAGRLQFDDPINIQFTSGTTGFPKGATLTHHNILNNGFLTAEGMRFTDQDRLCIPVPLYHCFGMVMGNLGCLTHGATMVYPSEAFDPLAVLHAVEAERCTGLFGVPTMFIAELDHPEFDRFDLSSLRTGTMAGSPCPIEVMKQVAAKMHMSEVTIAYGMTETSPVSFQSAVDDPVELRVSTVGRAHPNVEAKIIDLEGRIVPVGEKGEICTRGYCVMRGYWGDPERTAEAIDAAGWMHTGDLGVMDEQGYLNIVGRSKDMVIRGGENIYPREIEEYLFHHPKVQQAQVIGVPDPKYGEELCAWIMLKGGEEASPEDIRSFCEGQIAHYKIPRYIKFVAEFPLTVTGKVQKFKMRESAVEELGLTENKPA